MLIFRFATIKDIPIILSLIQELAIYEKLQHIVEATHETLSESLFDESQNFKSAEVMLAEFGGEPVGYALFFQNYSTFLAKPGIYLEDLFILPNFRNQGIGGAFFNEIKKIAHERHCGRLEWSVLRWNQSAIDFYLKKGAVPQSEWEVYRINL